MLDRPKSTTLPPDPLVESTSEPSTQHLDADQSSLSESLSRSTNDKPLYSIRVAESPGTLCAACGKEATGAGPVGYLDENPICDLCTLEGNSDLGMQLALAAVCRAYASMRLGTREERVEALTELGGFVQIYHCVARKTWPARTFRIPGSTAR